MKFKLITRAAILFSVLPSSLSLAADGDRLFTLKVLPLLKVKCFGCHGSDPEDTRGDYNLLTRDAMLKGGESEESSLVPVSRKRVRCTRRFFGKTAWRCRLRKTID